MIDEELLKILACPVCESRPPLRLDAERLICDQGRHWFPIENDIPHLLPQDANPLEDPS